MLNILVLSQLKKFALDCLFPQTCLFCRKNTEKEKFALICGGCFSKISFASAVFCPRCFRRRPKATNCPSCSPKLHLKILAAAASYEDEKIRTLIHKLKYNCLKELAQPLAELLINYLKLAAPRWRRDKSITLIPVPLHKRKENWRGFNQSELIGKIIAENFGWHFENSVLTRIRNNPAQVDLKSFKERRENVKNLFAVKKPEIVKNKKIVLIDDVFTSGATLSECARVLKMAGAKRIYGLVIARG
ncbi:MAG: ComF family protein [bacterium]|nr:ComF family protein [bacterium]